MHYWLRGMNAPVAIICRTYKPTNSWARERMSRCNYIEHSKTKVYLCGNTLHRIDSLLSLEDFPDEKGNNSRFKMVFRWFRSLSVASLRSWLIVCVCFIFLNFLSFSCSVFLFNYTGFPVRAPSCCCVSWDLSLSHSLLAFNKRNWLIDWFNENK